MTHPTVRLILTFLAAALAALLAADVPDLPQWVRAVGAALVAGFAAIGIVPPVGPRRP